MQGIRRVSVPLVFGPFLDKPNLAGWSSPVSGVLIQLFPGSGSVDNTGPIIYQAGTDVNGRATINFSEMVHPTIGWVMKVIYPVGKYDPSRPGFQLTYLKSIRL